MRNKKTHEGYAKVRRYGRAWLIIHDLNKPLSDTFGFEQTKREARKEIRELNARIAARASRIEGIDRNRAGGSALIAAETPQVIA